TYLNINFTVSDGLLTDSQAISIIVNDVTVPRIDSFYPAGGSTLFDEWTDFTASCSDADGYQDISEAGILVNTSQSAVRCLDSLFDFAANKIYLRNDTDTAWLGGFAPGSNNIIENSYCKLDCAKFTVSGSGNALQINGSFSYKFAFAGIRPKNVYVYVKDNANNFTGWVKQGAVSIQAAASKPFLNSAQYSLLDEFLNIHLNYFLSSEVITSSGLPFGAYSELDPTKFGYSNPTEWGYALLAWIIAADTGKITKEDAVNRINVMLQTLQSLQNNSAQNYHKLFYAYYHLLEPEGVHHDSNHDIPSIDNGFLYTSLWILQGWAKVNSFSAVENSANSIKNAMDFKVFLPSSKTYIAHTINADSNIFSSLTWNVFSDEGGAMAWIAYLSDAVTLHEYKVIVENMMRSQSSWNSITVAEAPWFNAMFTWAVRSLAGFPVASWETPGLNNNYSSFSFAPSVKAHLAYGDLLGIGYPAFSDAMTQPNMTKRYTPPNISNTVPTDIPNHVVPHAFFVPLCIGPDLEPAVLNTLFSKISDLKSDQAGYYHNGQDF
ncbi:MAG: hypothetical protein NTY47_02785, partial [Candidatus Omnitrophica bacterium]|nr:hypothetical protein [Candidatus Omnitrophota bacterium]